MILDTIKKRKLIIIIFVVVGFVVIGLSSSHVRGSGEGNFTLVGRWERIDSNGNVVGYVFNSNGTGRVFWYGESSSSSTNLTWSINGSRIHWECLLGGGQWVSGFTVSDANTTLYIYHRWLRRSTYTRAS